MHLAPKFSIKNLPDFYLAFSGGKDSLAIAHWLSQRNLSNFKGLAHFNHYLPGDEDIELRCRAIAKKLKLDITIGAAEESCPKGRSVEAWCRVQRYDWFKTLGAEIVTAHHLGDACEQYMMNFLKGCPEYKPINTISFYEDEYYIYRPWITTRVTQIEDYINRKGLKDLVVKDHLNDDLTKKRNWVRRVILPQLKDEGLETVVLKKFYLKE